MATEAANDIKVDEAITKPVDVEVKDETSEVVEPTTVETGGTEPEDNKSAFKQSIEPEKSEESSSTNGTIDSSVHESSNEGVDNEVEVNVPVQETETEEIKEPEVSETVSEKTDVEKPQDLSGTDTVPISEAEKVEVETATPPRESISDDAITAGSDLTNIEKEEKAATDTPEVIDTKEVAEGAVISEVPVVVADTKEVTEGAAPEVPDVVADVKVEQEKQDDATETEKPPTSSLVEEPAAEVTPQPPTTEVLPSDVKPEVVNENANEPHETVEVENSVPIDSSLDTETKEVGGGVVAEVTDVVEHTNADTNATVDAAPDVADVSAISVTESADRATVSENAEGKLEDVEVQKEDDTAQVEKSTPAETAETIAGDKIAEVLDDAKTSVTEALAGKENLDAEKTEVEADTNATVDATPGVATESADRALVSDSAEGKPEVVEKEVTTQVEKTTLAETVETIAGDKVAEVIEDAKASVTEALAGKENLDGEKTGVIEAAREFDVAGFVDKALATEAETKEAEPKTTEAKETLLDKFVNETSESKEEVETEKAAEEGATETGIDSGNPKTDEQATKQDNPSKSSQKNSNNIMSKVKQSIVKVKKAIIGKSPSSKTIQTDAKDDDTKAK